MSYRVAATSTRLERGRAVPAGELHAYLKGGQTSTCGRVIGADLVGFGELRWSARPMGLTSCPICFTKAR